MSKALEITGLSKRYASGVEALKGIDLSVENGDFFALLGPNGAGKSTTLGIVSSLINKTKGSVRILGHDLDTERDKAKRSLGVVPQEFNFSVFEKVEDILVTQAGFYGITAAEARPAVEHYLKELGLWEKRREQARNLSGGMKRRLMIARALVHDPGLLILDEPTAGVDIELRRSMWDFLTRINKAGKTIILTTHYLEEAEALCRNIAIIDRGSIVKNTSKKELLSQLRKQTFVIDLDQAVDEGLQVSGFESRVGGPDSLEVDILQGESLNGVFEQLRQKGLNVVGVRPKANRLEELFIELVRGASGGVSKPALQKEVK